VTVRVGIVEDRAPVREGLATLIGSSPGFAVAGAWESAEAMLEAVVRRAPDVLLMDIGLPGMDGIEAARQVRAHHAGVQVMMLTVYEDDTRVFESLRAGANGYVLKTTPPGELLDAIRSLQAGGSPMSSRIARRVVDYFHRPPPAVDPAAELTPREREILELLVQGFRYREIGARLGISLDTVRTHIRHIYEKLQVRSRTEATAKYLRG
jgi:DNA-binding NarL/FixJ family response regulator